MNDIRPFGWNVVVLGGDFCHKNTVPRGSVTNFRQVSNKNSPEWRREVKQCGNRRAVNWAQSFQ
jgi:hypothetical protein